MSTVSLWNQSDRKICHLLALLGAHHILHVSRIRVNVCSEFMESRWQEKQKWAYFEKNPSKCNFVHHRFRLEWPGFELWPPQWEDSKWLLEQLHGYNFHKRRFWLCSVFCTVTVFFVSSHYYTTTFVVPMFRFGLV